MDDILKKMGIVFQEPMLIEKYYSSLSGIFLPQMKQLSLNGYYLDLDALPVKPIDFKAIFIKWLVHVNLPRIKFGKEPIVTMDLAMRCPIWSVVPRPLKKIKLTGEKMFNKPETITATRKLMPGSLNKRKKKR